MSGTLRQIADLIGPKATLALCRNLGGLTYYIPKTAKDNHPFAAVVGKDALDKLCQSYGGERLDLPRGENAYKRAMVAGLLKQGGLSVREIAKQVGCTERFVSMVRNERGKAMKPLPLFDGMLER